jgi:hypothetical protein
MDDEIVKNCEIKKNQIEKRQSLKNRKLEMFCVLENN